MSQIYRKFVTLNLAQMSEFQNKIVERIKQMEKGTVFFPSDFIDVASPEVIRQTLSRLVKKDGIRRIAQGIYCIPRENKKLGLEIMPVPDEIAKRVAQRDKVKIVPTGDMALNQTGLSTQLPVNTVYLTNGARKQIVLNNGGKIIFRESNELRIFEFTSRLMMLIVSAMRTIGKEMITDSQIDKLRELLSKVPKKDYSHDILLAPTWVRKKLELI